MTTTDELEIEQLTIHDTTTGNVLVWREIDEEVTCQEVDEGRILVRLLVDGQFDVVSHELGRTGDLAALDRAIGALSGIRDRLARLYGDQPRRIGRCLGFGDWGQCELGYGHDGEHELPTEEDYRASEDMLVGARRREATA